MNAKTDCDDELLTTVEVIYKLSEQLYYFFKIHLFKENIMNIKMKGLVFVFYQIDDYFD